MFDTLFSPFACKSLQLRNRWVMAPMTRSFSPGGVPGENVAAYYARRAAGGVGLILTEGTGIDRPASVDSPHIPRFYGDAPLAGWANVVEVVRAEGGVIAPQLWHVGGAPRQAHHPGDWEAEPESPSGRFSPTVEIGRTMSESDVSDTIDSFARAAGEARRLGFGAVELHAAHGYLFDQFLWKGANRRTDQWNGPALPDRARFSTEVVRAVRRRVGPDFAILMRISQWKLQDYEMKLAPDPAALEGWVGPLAEAGVDIFDCSQRRYWSPEFAGSDLNLAGWVKKVTGCPTITVGSIGLSVEFLTTHHDPMLIRSETDKILDVERRLAAGEFDLVAVGRALLGDPEWAAKVRDERWSEIRDYSLAARDALI